MCVCVALERLQAGSQSDSENEKEMEISNENHESSCSDNATNEQTNGTNGRENSDVEGDEDRLFEISTNGKPSKSANDVFITEMEHDMVD